MLISQIFSEENFVISPEKDRKIEQIAIDSRKIGPKSLFIALKGRQQAGENYIPAAIKAGAIAVLQEGKEAHSEVREGVLHFTIPELQKAYGLIAARFYNFPSRKIKVIGVTGTNGKTSCAYYVATLLNQLQKPCAFMGTIGMGPLEDLQASSNTTPDALTIQAFLADMLARGFEYVAMEVSSHALDQERVRGVEFYAALYTNLTQDHLDYHPTLAHYARTKARLFLEYKPQIAVFNVDDEMVRETCEAYARETQSNRENFKICTYSNSPPVKGELEGGLDLETHPIPPLTGRGPAVRGELLSYTPSGMQVCLHLSSGEREIELPLLGEFNLSNVLGVLSLLFAMGEGEAGVAQLQHLKPVTGRMQVVTLAQGMKVVIDYAHTPDALEKALTTLRHYQPATLWCVFGCGGDRDRTKRPLMGAIASRYADRIILTDDNCRFEDPTQITTEIIAGFTQETTYEVISDRHEAIIFALMQAASNDWILIAGKGHENYQEVKGKRAYFSDIEEVEAFKNKPIPAKDGI